MYLSGPSFHIGSLTGPSGQLRNNGSLALGARSETPEARQRHSVSQNAALGLLHLLRKKLHILWVAPKGLQARYHDSETIFLGISPRYDNVLLKKFLKSFPVLRCMFHAYSNIRACTFIQFIHL